MQFKSILTVLLFCLAAAGCAPHRSYVGQRSCTSESVDIYFATDRHIDRDDPVNTSGYMLSDQRSVLAYGKCKVCIPPQHRQGNIEIPVWQEVYSPATTWLRDGSDKYFSIYNFHCLGAEKEYTENACDTVQFAGYDFCNGDFFGEINKALMKNYAKKTIVVYVHEFNNTFNEAAMRAAQIKHDIRFDGEMVVYAWPSRRLVGYTAAEGNSEWTQTDLTTFLKKLLCNVGDVEIYLLAHSMGSRILMRSLADIISANPSKEKGYVGRCKEENRFPIDKIAGVILAAADLDYDYFNRSVAKMLVDNKIFTTIYASSEDIVLGISEYKHKYQRIGEVGKSPFVREMIDTIDISQANSTLF